MLAYAIFVTLLLGIMLGIALTVWIAIAIQNKERAKIMKAHPSFTDRIRDAVRN